MSKKKEPVKKGKVKKEIAAKTSGEIFEELVAKYASAIDDVLVDIDKVTLSKKGDTISIEYEIPVDLETEKKVEALLSDLNYRMYSKRNSLIPKVANMEFVKK